MSVKVRKVACQQCGADLEVDESIRFVTCRYCSSRLEIVHDPSEVYTKVLEEMLERQEAIECELRIQRLVRKLEDLDRGWEGYRRSVSTRSRSGDYLEPSALDSLAAILVVLSIAGGLAAAVSSVAPSGFAIVPILAGIVICLNIGHGAVKKAGEFARLRHRYLRQRTVMKGQIHGLERQRMLPPTKRSGDG